MRLEGHLLRLAVLIMVPALGAAQQTNAIRPLPAPTGKYQVGTTVAYLTDSTRRDTDFPRGRPITLQVWYPSQPSARPVAPYLYEKELGAELLSAGYYGMDSTTIVAWRRVRTHSRVDAPVARQRHPLVALSVGQGVMRASYTSIAEELASHGYVVALVESPLQGFMVRPKGGVVTDTAGRFGTPEAHFAGVAEWSRDITYALNVLEAGRVKAVATAIDWRRVGATGHSSGGLVAVQACGSDERVRACVNMDGGVTSPDGKPMAPFVARGVTKPVMFLRSQPIYDDTTLARRGITRAEWEKRGEGGRIGFDSLKARSRGMLTVTFVPGTGHFSFSDAPFVMPTAITRFGGRIIDPAKGWTEITSALRAFFDERLAVRPGK